MDVGTAAPRVARAGATDPAQQPPAAATEPADSSAAEGGAALAAALLVLADAVAQERHRAGQTLFGIGPTELSALEFLVEQDRTPTALAERLHLTTASVTGLLDRLAGRGLVDRRPHPSDRRKLLVALSADARERLAGWHAELAATVGRATSGLSAAQRARLARSLTTLAAAVSGEPRSGDGSGDGTTGAPVPSADRSALPETLRRITEAQDPFTRPARRP